MWQKFDRIRAACFPSLDFSAAPSCTMGRLLRFPNSGFHGFLRIPRIQIWAWGCIIWRSTERRAAIPRIQRSARLWRSSWTRRTASPTRSSPRPAAARSVFLFFVLRRASRERISYWAAPGASSTPKEANELFIFKTEKLLQLIRNFLEMLRKIWQCSCKFRYKYYVAFSQKCRLRIGCREIPIKF